MADDAEEKARQEKLAAARKRVEQLKKKKSKKASETKKDNAREEEGEPADASADGAHEGGDKADDSKAAVEETAGEASPSPPTTPSLAQQSKLRSTSFRAGAGGGPVSPAPFGPEGDTAPDIYRKHVARIEELERENKRLAKEAADAEKRWNKAEEELSDLREADGDGAPAKPKDDETEKLKSEIASLQRQNGQLQQQVSRGGHRPSVSVAQPSPDLQAEVDSKTATIESMELEIAKLKARLERHETGASSEREQVTALEEKLARAEAAAGKAQRELQDVKRNLERVTEKAVREGSERSSAETKVKTLEKEVNELRGLKDELELKVDGLEKKVTTLTTLHKEQDSRSQALRKDKERVDKDLVALRAKLETLETDNAKLRRHESAAEGGGLDDEGVEELENEERLGLEKKIRSLEREVHELRSGAWIERRREMEPGFHDVDLSGGGGGGGGHKKASGGGIGDLLASGLNALAGGGDDGLLDDDGTDFDEEAFRKAQEEEAQRRLERVKEIKRSLKHWEGWRLDMVDMRRGGGEGIGGIFDV